MFTAQDISLNSPDTSPLLDVGTELHGRIILFPILMAVPQKQQLLGSSETAEGCWRPLQSEEEGEGPMALGKTVLNSSESSPTGIECQEIVRWGKQVMVREKVSDLSLLEVSWRNLGKLHWNGRMNYF